MKKDKKKTEIKVTTDIKCKSCGKDHAGSQGYCTDCMARGVKKPKGK